MTDTPELWIGGGGSVTMMSNCSSTSSRWLRPSAIMSSPVRVGEHRVRVVVVVAEHRRDRRHELDGIRPQAGDQRGPVRGSHPERHDERAFATPGGRSAAGSASAWRRPSGASSRCRRPTARRSRPPWPAWTDAISSSRDSNSSSPGRPCAPRSAGPRAPAGVAQDRDQDRGDQARAREGEAARPPVQGQADAEGGVHHASTTTIAGDPIVGMRTNGMTRLPMIAPVVFMPSSSPDSEPGVARARRAAAPRRSGTRCP